MRRRDAIGPLVGALVLASAPVHARAAEPASEVDPIALHWEAPATCPGADRVREHARRRMATDGTTPVVAHGVVRSIDASTWVLTLSLEGEGGREDREIRAASCDALAEAAGLLIAVAADPSRGPVGPAVVPEPATPEPETTEATTTEPTTTSPATAEPTTGPVTPTVVASPPLRRRRVSGAIRAELGGQFLRVLPRAADVTFGGAVA